MMITRSFSNLELFEFDKLDCAIAPIAHQFLDFAIGYQKIRPIPYPSLLVRDRLITGCDLHMIPSQISEILT